MINTKKMLVILFISCFLIGIVLSMNIFNLAFDDKAMISTYSSQGALSLPPANETLDFSVDIFPDIPTEKDDLLISFKTLDSGNPVSEAIISTSLIFQDNGTEIENFTGVTNWNGEYEENLESLPAENYTLVSSASARFVDLIKYGDDVLYEQRAYQYYYMISFNINKNYTELEFSLLLRKTGSPSGYIDIYCEDNWTGGALPSYNIGRVYTSEMNPYFSVYSFKINNSYVQSGNLTILIDTRFVTHSWYNYISFGLDKNGAGHSYFAYDLNHFYLLYRELDAWIIGTYYKTAEITKNFTVFSVEKKVINMDITYLTRNIYRFPDGTSTKLMISGEFTDSSGNLINQTESDDIFIEIEIWNHGTLIFDEYYSNTVVCGTFNLNPSFTLPDTGTRLKMKIKAYNQTGQFASFQKFIKIRSMFKIVQDYYSRNLTDFSTLDSIENASFISGDSFYLVLLIKYLDGIRFEDINSYLHYFQIRIQTDYGKILLDENYQSGCVPVNNSYGYLIIGSINIPYFAETNLSTDEKFSQHSVTLQARYLVNSKLTTIPKEFTIYIKDYGQINNLPCNLLQGYDYNTEDIVYINVSHTSWLHQDIASTLTLEIVHETGYIVYEEQQSFVFQTGYHETTIEITLPSSIKTGRYKWMGYMIDSNGFELIAESEYFNVTNTLENASIISSLPDLNTFVGETINLEWKISGDKSGTYQIYENGIVVQSGTFSPENDQIRFQININFIGVKSIKIVVITSTMETYEDVLTITGTLSPTLILIIFFGTLFALLGIVAIASIALAVKYKRIRKKKKPVLIGKKTNYNAWVSPI